MGKKPRFYQRQSTLDDGPYRSFAYAVVEMSCGCGMHQLVGLNDGSYYCKRCGKKFTYTPTTELYDTIDELVIQFCKSNLDAVRVAEAYLRKNSDNSEDSTDVPCEQTEPLEETAGSSEGPSPVSIDETEHTEMLQARASELEKELESARAEMEAESSKLREENLTLRDSLARLRSMNTDLDDTNRSLTRRLKETESIRTRDITEAVLEYAARMDNVVTDSEASAEEKEFAGVLTDRLFGMLDGYGVHVISHKRGEPLGEECVDILETPTEDPELDMRVAKTARYGCRFKDDVLPAIREDVTVYRFVPTAKEVEAETRIMAKEE